VMFQGRFVETGPSDALLTAPAHPYTRELVDAAPKLGQAPAAASGPPPRPEATIGCPYAARCPFARDRCEREAPALREIEDGRRVACHFPLREGD
jgi:peptide/nickel transport system ATP-binding protein